MTLDLNLVLKDALAITEPLFHIPIERRSAADEEVSAVLAGVVRSRLDAFAARWGDSPEIVISMFLEEYMAGKPEGHLFTARPRPLLSGGSIDTDIGARVHLKERSMDEAPFLYIYAGTPMPPIRRVVEFGLRFGRKVGDGDACIAALNSPGVRVLTEEALQRDIDLTSVYGADLDLEGDDDAHISMEPRWGRRAAFTVGFGAKDLPADLGGRVRGVLDSLWEPFLRCSLA